MKKPTLPTMIIIVLWVAYGFVTVYVLYQAIGPVARDLVNILGGFALLLLVGTAMLFLPRRRNWTLNHDQTWVGQHDSTKQA